MSAITRPISRVTARDFETHVFNGVYVDHSIWTRENADDRPSDGDIVFFNSRLVEPRSSRRFEKFPPRNLRPIPKDNDPNRR